MHSLREMNRFNYLFNQYVSKAATSAERMEFQEFLRLDEYNAQLKSLLDVYFANFEAKDNEFLLGSADEVLKVVLSARDAEIIEMPQPAIKKLWIRIVAVASVILVAGIGFYFYKQVNTIKPEQSSHYVKNIAPRRNGATLTLANGKKIRLTNVANGQLVKEGGVSITKTADGKLVYEIKDTGSDNNKINTLSTERGETYQLRLPDGSLVWLNSASSLTYTAFLNEQEKREVMLNGEAYFEIAKDKAHPFIVKTDKQAIEVLGTHFNVMAYTDEPFIKTTLLEGSVSITGNGLKVLLKPGELAINDIDANKINVTSVDAEDAIAWKNGYFNFDNENIGTIMKQISRWYDIDVEFRDADYNKVYWVANYARSASLNGLLKSLEMTGNVHFKIEGRRVIVMK